MSSFFDLAGFEYKKIFKRKSSIIALILVVAIACAAPMTIFIGKTYHNGEFFESHYEALIKDREYERVLSGRYVDEELLAETKAAYSLIVIPENKDDFDNAAVNTMVEKYARPYYAVRFLADSVYGNGFIDMRDVTPEDMKDYYRLRHEKVIKALEKTYTASPDSAAKQALTELDTKVKTPFVFSYVRGFDTLYGCIYTIGIACAFALAICLAPMFSGEYSARTDQLILSSRYGKSRQVSAKLFTAITLLASFFILLALISVILVMAIYGLDGANAPYQLFIPLSVYPITVLQAALLLMISSFSGTFLIVAATLLLSSKLKSPFGVIIVISVLLFVPMLFDVHESRLLLHNIFSLFPSSMMLQWIVFSHAPFNLFGLIVLPYVFLPAFAILTGSVMLPFARRFFRNHQIC